MLINITTTHQPATDFGYLLHKHPNNFFTYNLSMGKSYVFFPEMSETKATVSLLLDIDPIEMVRGVRDSGNDGFVLAHYLNDRPYVASSFLSVALSKAFSTAMNGNCKARPELVDLPFPFEVFLPAVPSPRGGENLIRRIFEPLGYEVDCKPLPLDNKFPAWGNSKYFALHLKNTLKTKELLTHLYVLIPALDANKHYFVNKSEIQKLLERGEGWLKNHPERELITKRYLVNIHTLSRQAIERLTEGDPISKDPVESPESETKKQSLNDRRIRFVTEKLLHSGAKRVLDLGCGDGKLIRELMKHSQFTLITGMDVSYHELLKAKEKLYFDEMSPRQKERIQLFQSSLTYRDKRLEGYDAVALVEVIEHIDLSRLPSFERVLFEFAKPKTIVLSTPNKEYNSIWEKMNPNSFRHDDHRFEWNRKEFLTWVTKVAKKYNYEFEIQSIGDDIEPLGSPTQVAVFTHKG